MATSQMATYSADDILRIAVPNELSGYELVDGELEPVLPAGLTHGRLAARLILLLEEFTHEYRIPGQVYSDAGFVLGLDRDPQRLRAPDVSFITLARIDSAGGEPAGFFHGAPDLAIEIDSEQRPRTQQRILDYLDAGTPLVWVIHAGLEAATVYHTDGSAQVLRESDALDGEDVLPGLRIPLRELFSASRSIKS